MRSTSLTEPNRTRNQCYLRMVSVGLTLVILGCAQEPFREQIRSTSEATKGSGGSTEALDRIHQSLQAGSAFLERADLSAAIETYEKAATNAREIESWDLLAESLSGLGLAYKRLGDYYQAVTLYSQALDFCHRSANPVCEAELLHNLGVCYTLVGELATAKDMLSDALAAWSSDYDRSATLTALASVYDLEGDHERAIEQLRGAFALRYAPSAEGPRARVRGKAITLDRLASAYRVVGRIEDARRAYEAALEVWRTADDPLNFALTSINLGWLHIELHRPEVALRYFEQALSVLEKLDEPHDLAYALLGRAQARFDLNDLEAATADVERSIGLVEELRSKSLSPLLRTSFLARRKLFYELHIELLMRSYEITRNAELASRALGAAEGFRARSLLDLLHGQRAALRQQADKKQAEAEEQLHREMNLLEHHRLALLHGKEPREDIAEIEKAQRDLVLRYDKLKTQISNPDPVIPPPEPLDPRQMRSLLDEDTILLVYFLGEKRSFVWMVDQRNVIPHALPRRSEIEQLARRNSELFARSDQRGERAGGEEVAIRLREMVLGPVESDLGDKRLVVVADGWLQYVPFAALPSADGRPLILDHELVTLPSVSVLAALRQRSAKRRPAPKQLAVVADPVFGPDDPRLEATVASALQQKVSSTPPPERLEYSAHEAAVILDLARPGQTYSALGFDATRQRVLQGDLNLYRIIHFAVHAELRDDQPEFTHLMLSFVDPQGQTVDGRLYLHEIDALELPAELIVLSACRTALGPQVEGEGVMSMTRGFMNAGASRVLVSLWYVSDEATARLMGKLYRELLIDGQTPAAALRQAQIWLRSVPRWQAPYYWAGFVLQGEWR